MEKKRILVIEDEFSINDVLTYAFRKDGFEVRGVYTGADALEIIDSFKPHLVLLDLMLPDMSGFDICKKICDKTFVIMVTARDDFIDKILGMEIGADDYVTKPFEVREVIARVKGIFRRVAKNEKFNFNSEKNITDKCSLRIDEDNRKIYKDNEEINLKRKEFDLLAFLYKNRKFVFSREELLDKVWGYEFEGDSRTVDVHVRRIRFRLNEEKEDSIIETIFGVGYVMR
ncbi:response regulator transcription factor [Clostridium gasigenes]|uniref:response regulator transcription factor n=1 Tax=Clostridium gasigenes TaxID=94869 RepID=UPI0016255784|nr:response regulator transcription factor [Clostridium gasigenes]MBB6621903.1 response regulator transcription factor [Clostridium gasigenes]